MKKLTLLLLFATLLVAPSVGQRVSKEVVYLKNGSVVKGHVVPYDDENMLVQSGRNTWVFKRTDIDTVASKSVRILTLDKLERPWFLKCSAGVLVGSSDNQKDSPFSFDGSFNMKMLPKFYLGAGAGVDFLEESYMPVFANFEYHFRESRFTPFFSFKGGYLFALDGDVHQNNWIYYDYMPYSNYYPYSSQAMENKGGMLLNPSFGFVSYLNPNLGLSLEFGYRYSQVTFKGDHQYELETNYNRLSIRLGILFN